MEGIIIDLIAVAVVLLFTIIGVCKGFFSTLLSILGGLGTIVVAFLCMDFVVDICNQLFGLQSWLQSTLGESIANILTPVIAVTIAFIVIRIVVFILNHTIGKIFRGRVLGGLDRSLGFVLGLLRGCFIALILFAVLHVACKIEAVNNYVEDALNQTYISKNVYNWVGDVTDYYFDTGNFTLTPPANDNPQE